MCDLDHRLIMDFKVYQTTTALTNTIKNVINNAIINIIIVKEALQNFSVNFFLFIIQFLYCFSNLIMF